MSAVTADVCDVAGDRGMWRCCLDEKKNKMHSSAAETQFWLSSVGFLLINKPGHL